MVPHVPLVWPAGRVDRYLLLIMNPPPAGFSDVMSFGSVFRKNSVFISTKRGIGGIKKTDQMI